MTAGNVAKLRQLIEEFVEAYCQLAQVNQTIGTWDMRRHEVCKPPLEQIDTAYLVKTERLGRQGVEARARLKTRIDELFAEIVSVRCIGETSE